MPESRASRSLTWTHRAPALLTAFLAAACVDDSVAPGTHAPPERSQPRVLGFVEISFDGIGTPDLSSTVLTAPSLAALEALRAEHERLRESGEDIALAPTPLPGNGTIQFGQATTGGQVVHDSIRYVFGTFPIRNAQSNGTAYDSPRNNVTLQAMSTDSTVAETAIRYLRLGDGSPADPNLALQVVPSGRVDVQNDSLVSIRPDVIQVVKEGDISGVAVPPNANTIFPYGFVVRTSNDNNRTLEPSPPPGVFEGELDIAFSIPQQPDSNDDPTSLALTFLALDYVGDTWVTQSLEEQTTPAAWAAVATVANEDNVSVLLNNGDGTFQTQQIYAAGSGPSSVAIGELDGDGSLDLATANSGSHDVSVLLGQMP